MRADAQVPPDTSGGVTQRGPGAGVADARAPACLQGHVYQTDRRLARTSQTTCESVRALRPASAPPFGDKSSGERLRPPRLRRLRSPRPLPPFAHRLLPARLRPPPAGTLASQPPLRLRPRDPKPSTPPAPQFPVFVTRRIPDLHSRKLTAMHRIRGTAPSPCIFLRSQ